MTTDEKYNIDQLYRQGMGYRRIASKLEISENTVKSYVKRHLKLPKEISEVCKMCGKPIEQTLHKRKKLFCSDYCRSRWWRKNTELSERKTSVLTVCKRCGKKFASYKCEKRRFCSRRCYIESLNNGKGVSGYNRER